MRLKKGLGQGEMDTCYQLAYDARLWWTWPVYVAIGLLGVLAEVLLWLAI